ncbi:MAG: aspartate/glutamate racemase family protein [Burkholderiaceae bacterium]
MTAFRTLLLNPNTSQWVTDALLTQFQSVMSAARGATLTSSTGTFGASYIACETAYAIATYACLDQFVAEYDDHDAVVIACFGDPALGALKELSPVPVIGMAEAAMREAAIHGPFSIVTGGKAWEPMLAQLARSLGYGDLLRSVVVVEQSAGELAADRDKALTLLADKCVQAQADGASQVILGGAAFAGFGDALAKSTGLPIIDSVSAAARTVDSLPFVQSLEPRTLATPPGGASFQGLTASLADRLPQ